MADKYSTIQQHQPLRVPASFDKQGRALIVQLDEIFDDIYRRYGRLKVSDLGSELKDLCLLKDEDGKYISIQTGIGTIQLEVGDIEGTMSSLGMTPDGIDIHGGKYIKIESGGDLEVNGGDVTVKAGSTLSIKSNADLEVDGGDVTIKSGGKLDVDGSDVTIKSGSTLSVKSNADLEVDGGDVTIKSSGKLDVDGGEVTIKSGSKFSVNSDSVFEVDSANLLVDETSFVVKEGILKGDHYDAEGNPLMRQNAIVVSTEPPTNPENNTVWVKPLDSVSVSYKQNISSPVAINGFTGSLTTGTAVADPGGSSYTYRLKFPVHANTSTGNGIDVVVTIGSLTFTQHIASGDYSTGFDRVFDQTVTSSSWIFGSAGTTSVSISISVPQGPASYYRVNTGTIELNASYSGSGGTGWKNCEVKVYKE